MASALFHTIFALSVLAILRSLPPDPDRAFQARLRPSLQSALILRMPRRIYLPAQVAAPPDAHSDSGLQSQAPFQNILIQPGKPVVYDSRTRHLPSLLYQSNSSTPVLQETLVPALAPLPVIERVAANGTTRPAPSASLGIAENQHQTLVPPALALPSAWSLVSHGEASGAGAAVLSIASSLPRANQLVEIPPVNQPGSTGGAGQSESPHSEARAAAPSQIRTLKTSLGIVEVRELPGGTKQLRFPTGGSFDVVIVESSPGSTIPDAERLLTGRPVQTVYITLGTGPDWILQYCLPGGGSDSGQTGMVVTLGRQPKLEPPFIQQALIPSNTAARATQPSLFKATLGVNGRFVHLCPVIEAAYQALPELLPFLEQWQFRPARVDGVAAEVEILLLVP